MTQLPSITAIGHSSRHIGMGESKIPSTRKMLVQMSGAPGSGKSTTAKSLGPLIDGVILDHDVIRSSLLQNGTPFHQAAKLVYDLNWDIAESIMQQDKSVIIDSTCNYQEILDRGLALARKYNYDYWYVECRIDDLQVLDERLRSRVPLRSQRTGVYQSPVDAPGSQSQEDAENLFQRWIDSPCRPDRNVIFVNSTDDMKTRSTSLLQHLYPFGLRSA